MTHSRARFLRLVLRPREVVADSFVVSPTKGCRRGNGPNVPPAGVKLFTVLGNGLGTARVHARFTVEPLLLPPPARGGGQASPPDAPRHENNGTECRRHTELLQHLPVQADHVRGPVDRPPSRPPGCGSTRCAIGVMEAGPDDLVGYQRVGVPTPATVLGRCQHRRGTPHGVGWSPPQGDVLREHSYPIPVRVD